MHANETSIFYAALTLCGLFGCIFTFFIITMVRQHRINIAMYKSKLSAEISTVEKERARIAADLHDDLGPMLSAVKMKLNTLDVSEEDTPLLEDAEGNLDDVIGKLRHIATALLPTSLLRKGLAIAVQEFISRTAPPGMKIDFQHDRLPFLPNELCINLYRIFQELIHNAIKHSDAANVRLSLTISGERLKLICADDGKGFDPKAAEEAAGGLGLRNIWSRTELLQGDVFLESERGEGTIYSIELPLQKK